MGITVKYQGHNGVNLGFTDIMEYLPRVGEMIHNPYLEDSGCTGMFIIYDITHERADDGTFSCVVQCIEFGDVDDKRDRLAESGHLPYH
jgi:hypothetical protein